jgi:hypothetical protein
LELACFIINDLELKSFTFRLAKMYPPLASTQNKSITPSFL